MNRPDGRTDAFVEKLKWELASWSAIEFKSRADYSPDSKASIDRIENVYIETASGLRFRDHLSHLKSGKVMRSANYFDGKRAASAMFDPKDHQKMTQLVIDKSFSIEANAGGTLRPWPLSAMYVRQVPLHLALPKGQWLGPSESLSRPTTRWLFKDSGAYGINQDLTYHLDDATGVPLRIDAVRDGHLDWTWTALGLDTVGKRHLPLKSVKVGYGQDKSKTMEIKFAATEVKYDGSYPKETFSPKSSPSATVIDQTGGGTAKVSKGKDESASLDPRVPAGPNGPPSATTATRSEAVSLPSGDWGGPALTLMGCAFIGTAFVLAWRRRASRR